MGNILDAESSPEGAGEAEWLKCEPASAVRRCAAAGCSPALQKAWGRDPVVGRAIYFDPAWLGDGRNRLGGVIPHSLTGPRSRS